MLVLEQLWSSKRGVLEQLWSAKRRILEQCKSVWEHIFICSFSFLVSTEKKSNGFYSTFDQY